MVCLLPDSPILSLSPQYATPHPNNAVKCKDHTTGEFGNSGEYMFARSWEPPSCSLPKSWDPRRGASLRLPTAPAREASRSTCWRWRRRRSSMWRSLKRSTWPTGKGRRVAKGGGGCFSEARESWLGGILRFKVQLKHELEIPNHFNLVPKQAMVSLVF